MMEMDSVSAYIKRGFELRENKSYKQAIEMFYKALELENNNIEILFQLGELYFLLLNFERAEHYFNKVLSLEKNHIDSLRFLWKIKFKSDNFSEALNLAGKLISVSNTPQDIIKLINTAVKLHDYELIESYANSEFPDVKKRIAGAYYELNMPDKAFNILKEFPNDTETLIILGKIYFDKNEFSKAKEIFESLKSCSDNSDVLNYLGLFLIEDGEISEAIKYFSKALSIDNSNSVYHYNLGNAFFYNGWYKEAANSYLNAIKLSPDNMDYRFSLANLYYCAGDYEKCKNEVNYILSISENHYRTRTLEAMIKFNAKDLIGAKSILEMNIKSGFNDDFNKLSLAKVYTELGYYDKSSQILKEIICDNPEINDYKCELAELLIRQKKYRAALEYLKKITDNCDTFIKAYILAAECEFYLNNYNEAREYASEALNLDTNCAAGYYWVGKTRFAESDYDEAIECIKRAIMFDLNNPEYYYTMSLIYEKINEIKSALEYASEAVNLDDSEKYRELYIRLAEKNRKIVNNSLKNLSAEKI